MKFSKIVCLFLTLFAVVPVAFSQNTDYINKHFILLVDQTPEVQRASNTTNMEEMYMFLKCSFKGEKPKVPNGGFCEDLSINPETDRLSVFGFGLKGCGEAGPYLTGDYGELRKMARTGKGGNWEDVYEYFRDHLIYKYDSYGPNANQEGLNDFLKNNVAPAFGMDGIHTEQAKSMMDRSMGAMTYSYYVYPMIMDPYFIDRNCYTSQYIIIVVTNYQSGVDDMGTSVDKKKLKEMLNGSDRLYDSIGQMLASLSKPFYKIPAAKIPYKDNMLIEGNSINLCSLNGVSAYITSSVILTETEASSTTYKLEDVDISFKKDDNLILDSIRMMVLKGDTCIYIGNVTENSIYSDRTKTYKLKYDNPLELGRVFEKGDTLHFDYTFFTTALGDDKKEVLLRLVFKADKEYVVDESTLKDPLAVIVERNMHIVIMAVALILLVALLRYIYVKRGKSRKVRMEFTIMPITHDRYMDVKDKVLVSEDCWYWREGDTDKNISIKGKYIVDKKIFAKTFEYRLEASIHKEDTIVAFSFRPDPSIDGPKGENRSDDNFYEVVPNKSGHFHFSANAYNEQKPDFSIDNILKMKVTVRCIRVDGSMEIVSEESHSYHFIVRPYVENTNTWVAFDPGTTGSCVAYGVKGNPTDDNIFLVENEYDRLDNGRGKTHIIPSKIRFNHKSNAIFGDGDIDLNNLNEGEDGDFLFGNKAGIYWDKEGVNCFQSIKKMLGYSHDYSLVGENGTIKRISGQDIAHLLVKGLYYRVGNYLTNSKDVDDNVKDMFVRKGEFSPQRAIVAVPNNYTTLKIQDMVDTIKRLEKFKEVHHIYEAEAVMMSYFKDNWAKLREMQDKLFVVFDMGGATINTTVFSIKVTIGERNGYKYLERIDVYTIGKIGYAVGGDDIDYAIIEMLYGIPSVAESINGDRNKHMMMNKNDLIKLAREIKTEIVKGYSQVEGTDSFIATPKDFYGHIRSKLSDEVGLNFNEEPSDGDLESVSRFTNLEKLQEDNCLEYVYSNVYDAIKNLFSSLKYGKSDVELIMSGRSILFPGVKDKVEEAIKDCGHKLHLWEGIIDGPSGNFNEEKVKSAVAKGACWYAMNSDYIVLHNNYTTSTCGYIDMVEDRQTFIPVIKRNELFDENDKITKSVPTRSNLRDIKFIQMLGAENEYESVWNNKLKHKFNILDVVYPEQIVTNAEKVTMTVDRSGNFDYSIKVEGQNDSLKKEDNPYSRICGEQPLRTEIIDENSESYLFATRNVVEEDEEKTVSRFLRRLQDENGKDSRSQKAHKGFRRF